MNPSSISHGRTFAALILCAVLVLPCTAVAFWALRSSGGLVEPADSWLPTVFAVPLHKLAVFVAGVASGGLALATTRALISGFDRHVVMYTVSGLYITFMSIVWIGIYFMGKEASDLAASVAQLLGIITGLALAARNS